MKFARLVSQAFVVVICSIPLFAVDLKVDTTFNPTVFTTHDRVYDVYVQPDGKLLAGGATCVTPTDCTAFLIRLLPDGSVDPTFVSPIDAPPASSVRTISGLANGQVLVTGHFRVGSQDTTYVRLNADGTVDPTMALADLGPSDGAALIVELPDGKFVACAGRSINGQMHPTVHRINADGSPDPSFRLNFILYGLCTTIVAEPDGKVTFGSAYQEGQGWTQPLHRLLVNGQKDPGFDSRSSLSRSTAYNLKRLANGKYLVKLYHPNISYTSVRRLTSSGYSDSGFPQCDGYVFLPRANGDTLATECRRSAYGQHGPVLRLALVHPNGLVNTKMDALYFDGEIDGIREYGTDGYYVYGNFRSSQFDYSRGKLQRLVPNVTPPRAKFDFDGDGRSDLAVFRPADRTWYVKQSSGGFAYMQFGISTDLPAAGHFDNDGKTDLGVFRDGVLHGYSSLFGHRPVYMGQEGDKPLLGNFDDSGPDLEDFAVRGVRDDVVTWFIRGGETAPIPVFGSTAVTLPNELITDKPVVGDFNADSRDEIGYFRDGTWHMADPIFSQLPQTAEWGMAGDIPVPGDYDGDRQTDYAIFRPSTGTWWINRSTEGVFALHFGQDGDIPVPADYDGDGKVDIAIYRDGVWWQYRMGTGTVFVDLWGLSGDIPIPAQTQ